jgi:hypothetical protein
MNDLMRYLTDHRRDLVSQEPDPAFGRELGPLIDGFADEIDDNVANSEIWRVIGKYPLVTSQLATQGFHPPASPLPAPTTTAANDKAATAQDKKDKAAAARDGAKSRVWPGREIVSAILAVLIVVTTLTILVISIFRTDAAGREAVKDALVFANGLLGVVLGYYFGRLPGETIAAGAKAEADRAASELDQMVGEVRSVLAGSPAQRGGAGALTGDQTERLRDLVARHSGRR